MSIRLYALALLALVSCDPVVAPPPGTPAASPAPVVIALPRGPAMTPKGLALVVEYEGYALFPEAPDARFSGISTALGYDWSTVDPKVSVIDWKALAGAPRLAATHPYTGRAAQAHLREVKDIRSPREIGFDVFNRVDVPRFYAICKKTYPGFESLRPGARDAVLSLVYNRGSSLIGPSRAEMRELGPFIKAGDYRRMADCLRRMKRVWKGTEIQNGMYRRREAEARMIES